MVPDFKTNPVRLLTIPTFGGEVFNMVISQKHDLLIAGCDKGLFAWKLKFDQIEKEKWISIKFVFF